MIVLMALCLYGTLACLAYGLILWLQQGRKSADERRRHSWIATRVDGYICVK